MTESGTDGPPAGAGPAFGEGPPPKPDQDAPARDLGFLAEEMRRIVGAAHVFTHEHQLATWLELLEPEEWEICCGSAGVYNLLKPEPAAELGRRKARNLLATEADAVASSNPGCSLQIASHSERLGRRLPVLHPMELLRMSIEGS